MTWTIRFECPNAGGVSVRSRIGAPPRKGCVVDDEMAKACDNTTAALSFSDYFERCIANLHCALDVCFS